MKTTKIETREVKVLDDVFCNKCGGSCKVRLSDDGDISNFEGLIEADLMGGYGSNYIGDGVRYTFSICEKCLTELFAQFKIAPDRIDINE